ncbi:MAG: tRNA (adenosine(37)-N6)-dimethylallyltransferase MiaA, partial [Acidobacteriia bacterium]|nr:tRNA (adenosine(37)-N6)-dimethylallyltransferase MiaA [Terriglobia bacterium]
MSSLPLVIVVAGPTGSGKSELALRLARDLDGEIVSCDSVQVYRRFNIGSAKLALEDRRGIQHHLIDVVEPDAEYTAGEYSRNARQALAEIAARGRVGIVTGGTGFYLTALLEGLFPGPEKDDKLRERLSAIERNRPGGLHRILQRMDPDSAARIHPNDVNKVMRALEVTLLGGQPMSEQFQAGRDRLTGFRILKFGLNPDRQQLYERIEERTRRMFAEGLIEETRAIL